MLELDFVIVGAYHIAEVKMVAHDREGDDSIHSSLSELVRGNDFVAAEEQTACGKDCSPSLSFI